MKCIDESKDRSIFLLSTATEAMTLPHQGTPAAVVLESPPRNLCRSTPLSSPAAPSSRQRGVRWNENVLLFTPLSSEEEWDDGEDSDGCANPHSGPGIPPEPTGAYIVTLDKGQSNPNRRSLYQQRAQQRKTHEMNKLKREITRLERLIRLAASRELASLEKAKRYQAIRTQLVSKYQRRTKKLDADPNRAGGVAGSDISLDVATTSFRLPPDVPLGPRQDSPRFGEHA
jgi:hypothetical protein